MVTSACMIGVVTTWGKNGALWSASPFRTIISKIRQLHGAQNIGKNRSCAKSTTSPNICLFMAFFYGLGCLSFPVWRKKACVLIPTYSFASGVLLACCGFRIWGGGGKRCFLFLSSILPSFPVQPTEIVDAAWGHAVRCGYTAFF